VKMWTWPQHHICEVCHQDMSDFQNEDDNVTCLVPFVEINGVQYRRTKYHFREEGGRCHDCRIKHGGIHHIGCDVEKCPVCDDQLISCNCKHKAFPVLCTRRRKNK
jgi:hypothetical protein